MNLALLGAQWGDEGKGKVTDYLASHFDYTVRFQGGANAGHTVYVNNKKYVFHLLPSGILHTHTKSIIDQGVVVDPEMIIKELSQFENIQELYSRLMISSLASVVTTYHKLMDTAREQIAQNKIGTTGRGIGPTYEDRTARRAIRMRDLLDKNILKNKITEIFQEKKTLFVAYLGVNYPSIEEEVERLYNFGQVLAPFIQDTWQELYCAHKDGKSILYEGAQGVLLDIEWGTYPYVTSSHTTVAGIYANSFVKDLKEVWGISKAYQTRVGSGEMPTELNNATGEKIRTIGSEFGATTGRSRRCGWLDLPLLKYATMTGQMSGVILTKLDILNGFDEIQVCIGYKTQNKTIDLHYPGLDHSQVEPIYKTVKAWDQVFVDAEKRILHPQVEAYLKVIEEFIEVPVVAITYGANREDFRFTRHTNYTHHHTQQFKGEDHGMGTNFQL